MAQPAGDTPVRRRGRYDVRHGQTRPGRQPLHLAPAVVLALVTITGCSPAPPDAGTVPSAVITAPSPSPSPSPSASAPAPDPLRIVTWGDDGTHLSVVVRNVSHQLIRSARVLITVFDHDGTQQVATVGSARSKCCTVLGLPPGKDFGLYLPTISPADVGSVTVAALNPHTEPWQPGEDAVALATQGRLTRTRHDVTVTARVRIRGPASPYVIGQAFLVDRSRHLRAVISGRYYCFRSMRERHIRMHLTYSAPPGTILEKVVAYPIPKNEPTLVGFQCQQ